MIYYVLEKQNTIHGYIWLPVKKVVEEELVRHLVEKDDMIIFTHVDGRYDHHNNVFKDIVINAWASFDNAKKHCIKKIREENQIRLDLVLNYEESMDNGNTNS